MRGESVSRDDMGGIRAEKILASRLERDKGRKMDYLG